MFCGFGRYFLSVSKLEDQKCLLRLVLLKAKNRNPDDFVFPGRGPYIKTNTFKHPFSFHSKKTIATAHKCGLDLSFFFFEWMWPRVAFWWLSVINIT